METETAELLRQMARVPRTKGAARASYDRMSRHYETFAGRFERPYRDAGLAQLAARAGETVLEVGFGTGQCVLQLADAVGPSGKVVGVDLSEGMRGVAQGHVDRKGLTERVELLVGDAAALPFPAAHFDAAFTSFTLDLIDTPEIPQALGEFRRVLRPGGRIAVVSMALPDRPSAISAIYGWCHRRMPTLVDCRPIPVRSLVEDADLIPTQCERLSMWGLPVEVVVAQRPNP